jgi:hypothetical protein
MNDKKLDQAATITKVIQLEKGKNSFTTEDEVPVSTLNRAHNPKKLGLKSTNKRQYKALKFETYRLGPKDLKYSLTPFEQAKFRVLETLFTREILENFLFPRKDFLTKRVQRSYKITRKDFLTKSENSLSIEKQRQILNSRKNVLYDLIYKSDINEITANKILGITGGSIGMGALGVEFTKFIIIKSIYRSSINNFFCFRIP